MSTPAGCWNDRPIDLLFRFTYKHQPRLCRYFFPTFQNIHQGSMRFRQALLGHLCTWRRAGPMLECHLRYSLAYIVLNTTHRHVYSPPLVGCSILITSALRHGQLACTRNSPTSVVGPYRAIHRVPKVSQYLRTIWLVQVRWLYFKCCIY